MDSFSSKHVPKAAAAAGLPDLPDVPTAAEAGFPGFEVMATDGAGAERDARQSFERWGRVVRGSGLELDV